MALSRVARSLTKEVISEDDDCGSHVDLDFRIYGHEMFLIKSLEYS